MMSGKFFLVALGSLVLYTLFINFGYVKFMDAQLYNVYLYDPAGTQTEVSLLSGPCPPWKNWMQPLPVIQTVSGLTPAVGRLMSCSMRQPKKQTDTEQTMRCPYFPGWE